MSSGIGLMNVMLPERGAFALTNAIQREASQRHNEFKRQSAELRQKSMEAAEGAVRRSEQIVDAERKHAQFKRDAQALRSKSYQATERSNEKVRQLTALGKRMQAGMGPRRVPTSRTEMVLDAPPPDANMRSAGLVSPKDIVRLGSATARNLRASQQTLVRQTYQITQDMKHAATDAVSGERVDVVS